MNYYHKLIYVMLTIIIMLTVNKGNANDNYELINSSEMSFDFKSANDLVNGVATEFYNPFTKNSDLYLKLKNTTIIEFTMNGQQIDIKNNQIEDGFLETTKYGKIKIGLHGQPFPTRGRVIVWLTPEQKAAFLKLKSSKSQ